MHLHQVHLEEVALDQSLHAVVSAVHRCHDMSQSSVCIESPPSCSQEVLMSWAPGSLRHCLSSTAWQQACGSEATGGPGSNV